MNDEKYGSKVAKTDIHRIQALSDAVFAIVMTLLIFGIHIPGLGHKSLFYQLIEMWPQYLAFVISFALLGMYWMGHKDQFYYIKRVNHSYECLNILFLSFVSFVPFSTQLLQKYPFNKTSLIFYAVNLSLLGLVLYWMWCYSIYTRTLVDKDIPNHIIRIGKMRTLLAPTCYVLSLVFMVISTKITLAIFAVIPALYVIPVLQKLWGKI